MKIAVFGSRDYPHLDDVRALVRLIASREPDTTIISGGARGVDTAAEQEAALSALKVLSFRVREIEPGVFGPEEWAFGSQKPYVRLMREELTWQDPPAGSGAQKGYNAALAFRNEIIVRNADRVVAFHDRLSRGTSLAMDFAKGAKRPLKVYGIDGDRYVAA